MFAFLRGTLHRKTTEGLVVDVGGVGYGIRIPLSTYYEIGEAGETVALRVTTLVREDSITLYGFGTEGEQQLFEQLIAVSGVGARLALAVLSGMSVGEVAEAISGEDVRRLCSVPGIGRKTAQRLILELRDRIEALRGSSVAAQGTRARGPRADVISALVNLGYPESSAARAAEDSRSRHSGSVHPRSQ